MPAISVHADWCKSEEISWTFRTDVKHWAFDIHEDAELFCRGIVIAVDDIAEALKAKEQT